MHSEQLAIGARVRVKNHRESRRQGLAGTVVHLYGDPYYRAVEVRLEDGRSELFWHHELEEYGGLE